MELNYLAVELASGLHSPGTGEAQTACKRQSHQSEPGSASMSASLKRKLRRCRTFSRGACRRYTEGLSTPGPRFLCVMNLHAAGREEELLSSLRSNQKF